MSSPPCRGQPNRHGNASVRLWESRKSKWRRLAEPRNGGFLFFPNFRKPLKLLSKYFPALENALHKQVFTDKTNFYTNVTKLVQNQTKVTQLGMQPAHLIY